MARTPADRHGTKPAAAVTEDPNSAPLAGLPREMLPRLVPILDQEDDKLALPGRAGPRQGSVARKTMAASAAISAFLGEVGIPDRATARSVARDATAFAMAIGYEAAALLEPEGSAMRELAGEMLKAHRLAESARQARKRP